MMDILVSLIVLSEWWNMFETRGRLPYFPYFLVLPSYSLVLSHTSLYSLVFPGTPSYSLVLPSYFLRTSGVRKSRFFPLGLKSIGIFDILDIFLIVNCRKNVFHFINIVMKLLIVYLVKMKIIVNYYLVIINHHFVVRVVQNV